jgi:hypothetical protein
MANYAEAEVYRLSPSLGRRLRQTGAFRASMSAGYDWCPFIRLAGVARRLAKGQHLDRK